MINYDDLQKHLQRGSTQIHEANNLIAEAYGVIGALVAENQALRKKVAVRDRLDSNAEEIRRNRGGRP